MPIIAFFFFSHFFFLKQQAKECTHHVLLHLQLELYKKAIHFT